MYSNWDDHFLMLNNKQMSNWVGGLSTCCHMCVCVFFNDTIYCIINIQLYDAILCYIVLFNIGFIIFVFCVDISITLFYFIFHYIMNHILLCHTRQCHILLCIYLIFCYIIFQCIILYWTVLYSFVLYHFLFHSVISYCCYFSILYDM